MVLPFSREAETDMGIGSSGVPIDEATIEGKAGEGRIGPVPYRDWLVEAPRVSNSSSDDGAGLTGAGVETFRIDFWDCEVFEEVIVDAPRLSG